MELIAMRSIPSAIENDAVYAVEKLNGQELQGRRMRLGM